jgi:hypothetical protein
LAEKIEKELEALEDSDVKAERERVNAITDASKFPLIVRDMRKIYGSGKVANKSLSLAVEKNMVFGLLGPVQSTL